MQFEKTTKSFSQLSVTELYVMLHLRAEVFVVEQECIYQDLDNKDQTGYHCLWHSDGVLAAYCRLLPAGVSFKEMSIGRVIVAAPFRKSGLGKQLMQEAINDCYLLFGEGPIRIGAQLHLTAFYNAVGFIAQGQPYDEDGIMHIEMLMP